MKDEIRDLRLSLEALSQAGMGNFRDRGEAAGEMIIAAIEKLDERLTKLDQLYRNVEVINGNASTAG